MPMKPITLMGYECLRCEHKWRPKVMIDRDPRVCPKCKSAYWNVPKRK